MQLPEFFETERLIARPPRVDDAPAAFVRYANDPVVTKFLSWRPHADVATVAEFFGACADHWRNGARADGHYPWLLFLRDTNELIGSISAHVEGHAINFGYAIARAHWSKGLTTEALSWLVDWSMAEPNIHRAWAFCDVENPASARVMEKSGMTYEGILRRWHMCPTISDTPRDCYVYAKVR